ncbi:hypothetical protein BGX27_001094 [Mortierella sp. AM989]|nr:hypothetical protein BGX27_001094 [Mortierella sp. AM989]
MHSFEPLQPRKRAAEDSIATPPKRTRTGVQDVDEEVTIEKEVEEVKECPRVNPPMWTRVDVEEVSEDVLAEEAEAEVEAVKDFLPASAPMGTSAGDEDVDAKVVAEEEGKEVITQRDLDIREWLLPYHSSDISQSGLEAIKKEPMSSILLLRYNTMGTKYYKYLVALDQFIESGTKTEGELTDDIDIILCRSNVYSRAMRCQLHELVLRLWPSTQTKNLQRVTIMLGMFLIAIKAEVSDFCEAAVVAASVFGQLNNDLSTIESIKRRFFATSQQLRSNQSNARITSVGDLRQVEAAIGYSFRNRTLLEDAMSNVSSKASQQGLSFQRLELIGDALLDAFVVGYWSDEFPNNASSELARLHTVSTDRNALSAAIIALGIQKYIHRADKWQTNCINKTVNDLIVAKGLGNTTRSQKPYWESIRIKNKILCDVFESLLGAVLVDSEFDIPASRAVFENTLGSLLGDYLI